MSNLSPPQVVIIGGGPSGLMAAEVLSLAGVQVDLYDAMPSLGRKLLLAGIGGLNITHSEDYAKFCSRYGLQQADLQAILNQFPPEILRTWVHDLGIETFIGSSGRVFPTQMKAAPLLRVWLQRLRRTGVRIHVRHRWLGWDSDGALRLQNANAEIRVCPSATLLALGGASWPQLGSDAAWVPWLAAEDIQITPLQSANCGFEVAWSSYIREQYAGTPLKSVAISFTNAQGVTERRCGELMISQHGIEGSLIYAFSRALREQLNHFGAATFLLDLVPGRELDRISKDLLRPRGSDSFSKYLKKCVGISGLKIALLHEILSKEQLADPIILANKLKALPITVHATRPLAEAISTAGGVCFANLDANLMLTQMPGTFIAGEMLDWEVPTGGYLLTACFATGKHAGLGVLNWLAQR